MVRAFMPQAFPGLIVTNTNFPPQDFDEAGSGGVTDGLEAIGGTTDNIIWDDGIDGGNIKFQETP